MTLQLADIDPGDLKRGLLEHYRREGFDGAEELLKFIESFWKFRVPRAQVCPEHTPPAEYIVDSFFEMVQDSVCWANRGGGKTLLGALATWLDTVFKIGCATKILGGSLEQSKTHVRAPDRGGGRLGHGDRGFPAICSAAKCWPTGRS